MEKEIYYRILRVESEKIGLYLLFTVHYSLVNRFTKSSVISGKNKTTCRKKILSKIY